MNLTFLLCFFPDTTFVHLCWPSCRLQAQRQTSAGANILYCLKLPQTSQPCFKKTTTLTLDKPQNKRAHFTVANMSRCTSSCFLIDLRLRRVRWLYRPGQFCVYSQLKLSFLYCWMAVLRAPCKALSGTLFIVLHGQTQRMFFFFVSL